MAGRRRRAQWLIGVVLFGVLQAAAGGAPPVPAEPDDNSGRPSVDLLLFLADFDDSDGEVIDRAELSAAQQREAPTKPSSDDDDDN